MVLFVRAHNGVGIMRRLLPKPCPISLKRCMPWTIAVDVLPCSRICETQLIRCNPDNIAESIMKGFHLNMEVPTMQGQHIREAECCPEFWARKSAQWM